MTQTLLIAGAGANQIGIFTKAREMGIQTIAADGNPHAPGFGYADQSVTVNILDAETLVAAARKYNVDGIYPAAELAVEAVSVAAQSLGLTGVPPEVAQRVRNKAVMRRALDAAGVPNPVYHEANTLADAQRAVEGLGFPLIIKPCDANSSKGVQQLSSFEELEEAFNLAIQYSFTGSALLEEFIEGEEFCVDGLVCQDEYIPGGITGKEMSPLPYRFDKGIFMPPNKSQVECDVIENFAREALQAIGFENGTFHLEIIVSPDGPRIVEIAGRPGGGRIATDLIPIAYGYDFIADSIRIALGEAPQSSRRHERGVALFWIEAEPGRVTEIVGREEALAIEGVEEVVIHTRIGDELKPIIDCVTRDAIGYVFTSGASASDAIEAVNRARSVCKVITA
ncbi:MAG: ATP-grasp domain-containing protein [Candidatus Hydrogenedentota bacterium]